MEFQRHDMKHPRITRKVVVFYFNFNSFLDVIQKFQNKCMYKDEILIHCNPPFSRFWSVVYCCFIFILISIKCKLYFLSSWNKKKGKKRWRKRETKEETFNLQLKKFKVRWKKWKIEKEGVEREREKKQENFLYFLQKVFTSGQCKTFSFSRCSVRCSEERNVFFFLY